MAERQDYIMGYSRTSGEEFDRVGKPMFIGNMPPAKGKSFADVSTFEDTVDVALGMMREVILRKQREYGPNAVDSEIGIAIRSNDKVSRLRTLLNQDSVTLQQVRELVSNVSVEDYDKLVGDIIETLDSGPQNESIEDTWMDLANYGMIGLMFHNGAWGRPFKDEQKDTFVEVDDSDEDEGNVY